MKVLVKFFGPARDWTGEEDLSLFLPYSVTLRELKGRLSDMFTALRDRMDGVVLAVNGELAGEEQLVGDGDEIAFLPPICGGALKQEAELTEEPLDVATILSRHFAPFSGGVASFVGVIRGEENGKEVESVYYEAYFPLAMKALQKLASSLKATYNLNSVEIVHRIGKVKAGEPAVVIVAAASHRQGALQAVQTAIERLKQEVPIWKKEVYRGGESQWKEGLPLKQG